MEKILSTFIQKWDLDQLAEDMLRRSTPAVRQQAMATFHPPLPLRNISARFVSFLTRSVNFRSPDSSQPAATMSRGSGKRKHVDDPVGDFVMKWRLDARAEMMLRRTNSTVIIHRVLTGFSPEEGTRNVSASLVSFMKRVNSGKGLELDVDAPNEACHPYVRPLPEDPWERYFDPETRRAWMWCPSTRECFYCDGSSDVGWKAFWHRNVGIWWWHSSSGRCFVECAKPNGDDLTRQRDVLFISSVSSSTGIASFAWKFFTPA